MLVSVTVSAMSLPAEVVEQHLFNRLPVGRNFGNRAKVRGRLAAAVNLAIDRSISKRGLSF